MLGKMFQLSKAHKHLPAKVRNSIAVGRIAERLSIGIDLVKLVDDFPKVGQPRATVKVGMFTVRGFIVQYFDNQSLMLGPQALKPVVSCFSIRHYTLSIRGLGRHPMRFCYFGNHRLQEQFDPMSDSVDD